MKRKPIFRVALLSVCLLLLSLNDVFAQEYEYEIGGMVGVSSYMGDANKTALYKKPGLATGAVFRYNKNFRWAYKGTFVVGRVSGDSEISGNVFPYQQHASFSRSFAEIGGQVEFNFFPYSDRYPYLGTKKFSPYLFTGLGLTMASGKNTFIGVNLPLGVGLKYKIKERLNLGFEFSFRKLFDDSFDSPSKNGFTLDDPYNVKSSFMKNKDWYSLTMFSLTWDFGLRKKSCVNDELYSTVY